MDEKTARLRDLFLDLSDEETVTETQADSRGSLETRGSSVDDPLAEVIDQVHDRFDHSPSLSEASLLRVVRGFYAGDSDEDIATAIEADPEAVFDARLSLHLVRDDEIERLGVPAGVEQALRRHHVSESAEPVPDLETDLPPETLDRARRVIESAVRARRVSYRFRTAFEEILTDADLSVQFTADTHWDGLEDATEGAEVDVDF